MRTFIRTDANDPGYRELVALLDRELKIRDGDDHAFFAQYNKSDDIRHVVLAYDGKVAAGCGAFKYYSPGFVEIKRMYVRPEFRGQKIASGVLTELESWASELGNTGFILETGMKQPEAIALYKKSGYSVIPNYGQYQNIATSVCFEKRMGK
jgi:putative acetyltransferase